MSQTKKELIETLKTVTIGLTENWYEEKRKELGRWLKVKMNRLLVKLINKK